MFDAPHLQMCLLEYVLSVEHDGVDPSQLLEDHQHDADQQRLVDTRVLQVRHLEPGPLGDMYRSV